MNTTSDPLYQSIKLRELEIRNRIVMSPMCQYSATDGVPNDWHIAHYGARADGGVGLIIAEASGVESRGRISPGCTGIWNEAQVEVWSRIVKRVHHAGAAMGIQLAHAGRKASTYRPWDGHGAVPVSEGGWQTVSSVDTPFADNYPVPKALTESEIDGIVESFAQAAKNALKAGFDTVEIHGAHGYLLSQFYSPLVNTRTDQYGGSFENRVRLPLRVAKTVRAVWPANLPVLFRLNGSDWLEGGWTPEDAGLLASELKTLGIDLIDVSSGGAVHNQKIVPGPGYQVPFASRVKSISGSLTSAVGLITEAEQARAIIRDGHADFVMLGRELLRDASWPLRNAPVDVRKTLVPVQYARAY